ncbi:MAG: TRAP transporter small permease [Zetaproteobacteria bacterium]|nr:MAG: TRAP transporter small permease [Zetaproteobacteria bacterium]
MKKWIDRLTGALLILMFLSTFFQVVARNLLHVTAMWTEELAKFLFVFIVFLGAATLMEREEHITITVLSDRLPPSLLRGQRLVVQFVLVAFGVAFVWSAWMNVLNSWEFYAPSMPWFRMSYLYLVLVFSGILTLSYILLNVLRTLFPGRFGARRESAAG